MYQFEKNYGGCFLGALGGIGDKTPRGPALVWADFYTEQEEETMAAGRFNFNPLQKTGISTGKRNSVTQCDKGPNRDLKPHAQYLRAPRLEGTGLSPKTHQQASHFPCSAVRLEPSRVLTAAARPGTPFQPSSCPSQSARRAAPGLVVTVGGVRAHRQGGEQMQSFKGTS